MKQLPPDTVRLLSSSQVITSVVNVVKELLENSLDAGALCIDVKLENYGLDRIEVRDNGHGIKAVDTPVMAVRHFTSKIFSHQDLEQLQTYGFRGEALGSICCVAEVAVTTKTSEDDISTQYVLDFTGKIVSQKASHLGQGTTVSVLKLFKNLPVRRQFYSSTKKCKEEVKKVQELLVAYAIIRPELRLTLTHNRVVVWQKAKVADHRSALLATLGSGAVSNLVPCRHQQEEPEILLEGFFPKPGADHSSTSSTSPDRTFLFVNSRPVHNKDLMKVLRQRYAAQYAGDSARSRYPHLLLRITVPPSSVDVNLTPDKTQVLLHHKDSVLTAVETMLVSLYGSQPSADTPHVDPPVAPPDHLMSSSPTPSLQTDTCDKAAGNKGCAADESGSILDAASDASLDHQTTNSSSSSSVAEDWVLSLVPGGLQTDSSVSHQETNQPPEANSPSQSWESGVDGSVPAVEAREARLSAETWSRGTALTDPVSGEPLQPIKVHQESRAASCDPDEDNTQSSSSKTTLNAITEKRAGLTAYDLISSRALKTPQSAAALFERGARVEILRENPTAGLQDISDAVHERWKNLREEEREKYEETAKKHMETHEHRTRVVSAQEPTGQKKPGANSTRTNLTGQKRKAPLSNQQLLDELFSAQPPKKMRTPPSKPCQPLVCSMAALRQRLQRLSQQSGSGPRGPRLVKRLAPQSAWVILCGQKLMLLNPFLVEEALLFKRLLDNNIVPAVSLQEPIRLTDGTLGGVEYTRALCAMKKQPPELDGASTFSDPRLVANGFKIRLIPGLPSAETHLEVTAMADCVPYFGVADLREVLTAVVHRKATRVHECRPLKVTNYLQGEAVRLARQLPTDLSRKDVEQILLRMEQQLGESSQTCSHGRPFLHHLTDVPRTDLEAKALLVPLDS